MLLVSGLPYTVAQVVHCTNPGAIVCTIVTVDGGDVNNELDGARFQFVDSGANLLGSESWLHHRVTLGKLLKLCMLSFHYLLNASE